MTIVEGTKVSHRNRQIVLTETQTALAVFICAFMLFAACIPRITTFLDPVTGDEPFYFITAYSIVHDHDIDETNNFANRDWLRFYPSFPLPPGWQGWPNISPNLPPHAGTSIRPGLYSKHGLGVPVIIAVPFAVGGRTGAVLFYNLLAAGVAVNIYLLARSVAARQRAAIITAVLMVSVPLLTYAYLIFPEMPAALAIIYSVRRIRAPMNTRWQWALMGLAVGLLPWLHSRFIPVVAAIALIFALRHLRHAWRPALFGIVPATILLTLFEWYSFAFYDSPVPLIGPDRAPFSSLPDTINGVFGSLIDAQWGLLIVAPVYLLALAALARYCCVEPRDGVTLMLILVPYVYVVCRYRLWWGEWGPAGRYMTAALPLLALPLAWWWEQAADAHPRGALWLLGCVCAWDFIWTAGWLRQPQWLYNQPDGRNNLLIHWLGGFGSRLASGLPAYQFYAESPIAVRRYWGIVLILVFLIVGSAMVLLTIPAGDDTPRNEEPLRSTNDRRA